MQGSRSQQVSCGFYFAQAREWYCGDDEEKVQLFAAGFVVGQAEKIYLGACQAAMFRPSAKHYACVSVAVRNAAKTYGLAIQTLRVTASPAEEKTELWLLQPRALELFTVLSLTPIDSPEWHVLRGLLCGVPMQDVDYKFHVRWGAKDCAD